MKKNQNGITLIALVITIIVLLILAGVSIALLTSDGNILDNAGKAKTETGIGTAKDLAGIRVSGYLNDYYNYAYVTKDDEKLTGIDTAGEYVCTKLAADTGTEVPSTNAKGSEGTKLKDSDGYTFTATRVSDTVVTGVITIVSGDKTVEGKIDEKGILTWNS